MTSNQIAYWRDKETERANREKERQNLMDLRRKVREADANIYKAGMEAELASQKADNEYVQTRKNLVDMISMVSPASGSGLIGAILKALK